MFHPCLPHPSPFRGARGASQRHWHALVAAGWLAALPAFAQQAMTDLSHAPSIYLQGAIAEHDTEALTLGLTLPWREWRMPFNSDSGFYANLLSMGETAAPETVAECEASYTARFLKPMLK